MQAKKKIKKVTKTVAEKDIPQLSGTTIIQKRIEKCVKDLGEFKPEEICNKCKFCKWYALAKTPFNSKYRQMDAWKNFVKKNIPCEYLNGIENDDGEIELLRGSQDACENFKLAWERVPQKLKDIIENARKSDSVIAGDEGIKQSRSNIQEAVSEIDLQIEQTKLQLEELKNKKSDLEEELSECYAMRFSDLEEIKSMNANGFAQIAGIETYEEDEKREQDAEKLKSLGFAPNQKKVQTLKVTIADIERIQAKSTDSTYGGFFNATNEKGLRIDNTGNTLASYAGHTFEFETELVEVAKSKGFRKQVIFQETDENFEKRKGISILEILCGGKKMRWREDVVAEPRIENMNEVEEDADEDEDGEGEE